MNSKQNWILFGSTLAISFLIRNSNVYLVVLHELNHLFMAALTGNIPTHFTLDISPWGVVSGLAYYVAITARIFPFIDNLIGAAGPGFAIGALPIVYMIGLKLRIPGIVGLWVFGIPGVLVGWGTGEDFAGITNEIPYIIALGLITILLFMLAGLAYVRDYEKSIRNIDKPKQKSKQLQYSTGQNGRPQRSNIQSSIRTGNATQKRVVIS